MRRLLAAVARAPEEEVGVLGPKFRVATVEKIAINATMAWCRPEYMPVLVAAVEAMAEPQFNLYGLQATTHPTGTPLLLINGPVRQELEINGDQGCFGHGTRANATIGRAIRLILTNVGGAYPGETDMSTHGWPGKFGFCCGENEERLPEGWEPLHVERGYRRDESAVTVVGTGGTCNFGDLYSTTAEGIVASAANALSTWGTNNITGGGGEPLLVLGPEHAAILAREGLGKAEVRHRVYERCGFPVERLGSEMQAAMLRRHANLAGTGLLKPAARAGDIMVVVAGGAGGHSVFIPTWGADTRAVTRPIRPRAARGP